MTNTMLFGRHLAPLYAAIAQVESDRGKTSANVYQIDAHAGGTYVKDVNQILARLSPVIGATFRPFPPEATSSKASSEAMMAVYWKHWGTHYEQKTGKQVTFEVLARIHNGGPLGWKKTATDAYWAKVKRVLETQTLAEVEAWIGGAK